MGKRTRKRGRGGLVLQKVNDGKSSVDLILQVFTTEQDRITTYGQLLP